MKICFNGCSLTVGEGFPEHQRPTFVYNHLVSRALTAEHDNIAKGGSSNYLIFMRSAEAIMTGAYDVVITQWSALNRLWLYPGPDCSFFTNDIRYKEFNYRGLHLGVRDKKKFCDTIKLFNHDYANIFDLIDYCKILNKLAETNNTKNVFVNGLVPWCNDLTRPLGPNLATGLSEYTKSILDFESRNDVEIIKFFKQLQEKFTELDQTKWVNLFDSFDSISADLGPEGHHPGINSHQLMADKIIDYIKMQIL
jgi:hypothetical protein